MPRKKLDPRLANKIDVIVKLNAVTYEALGRAAKSNAMPRSQFIRSLLTMHLTKISAFTESKTI